VPLPAVTLSKVQTNIGSAPPSPAGILAIIAGAQQGPLNTPGSYSRSDLALSTFGAGPLVEYGAYDIDTANQPFVAIRSVTSQAATYGTITLNVTGTSVVTAGATAPLEHYQVVVKILVGGTIGVAGILYQYALDGSTFSGTQALGTAITLTIPNSGVSFALAAGTLIAGDNWSVYTERALSTNADLAASLTALGNTRIAWEGALIDSVFDTSTVGVVDAWLSGLEGQGQFKFALLNTRFKTEPEPTGETEAAYTTAVTTLVSGSTSIRICVGADGGHLPSPITGLNLKRPTSLALAARAMQIPIGEDPAYVARGPCPGFKLPDAAGNPLDHDENLFPNLDGLRVVTLRSFAAGGPDGVYVTNANSIQASGGDFVYLQHLRIMNRACTIAWAQLTKQLSRGVSKNPKKDPNTGATTILESDASAIEALVNGQLQQALKGQVSQVLFSLSRTDDLSVIPATVHGLVSIVAKAYIKGYLVTSEFSKTLQIAA
jgi:hypothetical protein